MSDRAATDNVASLYRRFRPGRFAEMRGQEHVVRALQGAVANDRIVHAYLFSGPRGTGKTTTARILAKALNCESPVNGDACNTCDSCVAITRGTSLDVVELDAASNNGVDDIREIISGAWHGTPGRWKVYIVDEVHMLSKAAEAAFLKTLEEPPPHVVFVLATTDPHKVVATIRSRTQHLEFRLLNADTLNELLHEVRDAAHLEIDEETLAAAVRMGRGSARDALSALDQVMATGSLGDAAPPFDVLLEALANADAVTILTALSDLSHQGWDAEQLAESFAGELRQIFLLLVAPDVSDALDIDRDRLSNWGRQLGLPRTVRALETVGRTLREMKSSPVPSIMLEVALVRLARPELDDAVSALDERLARLERMIEKGGLPAAAPTPAVAAPREPIAKVARPASASGSATASAPTPAPTPTPSPAAPSPESQAAPSPSAPLASSPEAPATASAPAPSTADETLTFEVVADRFHSRVVPRLSRSASIFLTTAELRSFSGSVLTIAVPSEALRVSSEKIQSGLRSALEHEFRQTIQVTWIVDPAMERGATSIADPAAPPPRPTPPRVEDMESLDDREIAESDDLADTSVASMLITEAFPGAEELS